MTRSKPFTKRSFDPIRKQTPAYLTWLEKVEQTRKKSKG